MTTAYTSTVTVVEPPPFAAAFTDPPGVQGQQRFAAHYARQTQLELGKTLDQQQQQPKQQQQQKQHFAFPAMDVVQPPPVRGHRQPSDPEKAALVTDMGGAVNDGAALYEQQIDVNELFLPSPYDPSPRVALARNESQQTTTTLAAPQTPAYRQQSGEVSEFVADTRGDAFSESNRTPVQQPRVDDEAARQSSIPTPMSSRRPSSGLPSAHLQEPQFPAVLTSNSAPAYKPSAIPISASTRAIAQQPTYITPPSSPTPIAVNTIYNYRGGSYGPEVVPPAVYDEKARYLPMGFAPPEGKEICVECAMRDEDMADVDVTGPGVWERESDVFYHELCRVEAEEAEERMRARASNSSSESHAVLKAIDPTRPRAKGHRLTEQNLKLWLSMNPREPQARQQTMDLYIKTQTALLEAEALARARALQESRILENKLRDTYDSLRRSTYEMSPPGDDGVIRVKGSHASKRSVSGSTPISLVVDGPSHHRNQSQSREVTILENGMIMETVDVRKEEKERRREERRERSRARKSSRGSGGAEVMSMYSVHSPLPHQTDFYSVASNGSGILRGDRPMSLSQASTRAMSTPLPLTPPAGSPWFGPSRPPNVRVHSQVSLVDSQSISSASLAGRRSRFFAFRNWSEAWKSRESFAPSAVMSVSGSMMDMHIALDREKQNMHTRPSTVDYGGSVGLVPNRHAAAFPRRASVSLERPATIALQQPARPKKKRGMARIWDLVRGSKHSAKIEEKRLRDSQYVEPIPRAEDDAPLAPPPPLSYLVNRSPRERTLSTGTQRNSMVVGMPAQAANGLGAGALPTPTSIRNPWQEHELGRPASRMLSAHPEETSSNGFPPDAEPFKPVHAVASEPDMRQVQGQDGTMLQAPPMPPRTASAPRPISVYSLHKSLPPLPPEVTASQSMPSPAESESARPRTMYDLDSPVANDALDAYPEPDPSFRRDTRRSSFAGMSSPLTSGTFPLAGRNGQPGTPEPYQYNTYSPYAELGVGVGGGQPMARSLGRLGADERSIGAGTTGSERTIGKRRSRFGLAGLVERLTGGGKGGGDASMGPPAAAAPRGQWHEPRTPSASYASDSVSARLMLQSESDLHSQSLSGTDSGRSRHEQQQKGVGGLPPGAGQSRMSVASRRAIEELVDQDPNFVAYRYPSVDQNIALLR